MKRFNFLLVSSLLTLMISCSNSVDTKEGDEVKSTKNENATNINETDGPVHLTKNDFLKKVMNYEVNQEEWVFEGTRPCIVDFYADWCGPCKIVSPIMEELALEYAGKVDFYKVNTDKERELSAAFGIRSIPSFLIVPLKGKPSMSSGIGRSPEETKQMFRQMIEENLLKQNL